MDAFGELFTPDEFQYLVKLKNNNSTTTSATAASYSITGKSQNQQQVENKHDKKNNNFKSYKKTATTKTKSTKKFAHKKTLTINRTKQSRRCSQRINNQAVNQILCNYCPPPPLFKLKIFCFWWYHTIERVYYELKSSATVTVRACCVV